MLTPEELEIVRLSVKVALVSVAISVPFGVAVAYALARWQFPGKSLFDALVHLPLVLPPVVVGYWLLLLFGRRAPLGQFLEQWFGIVVAFRWSGAAIASAVMSFPLMVRAMRLSMESIDPKLEAAAQTPAYHTTCAGSSVTSRNRSRSTASGIETKDDSTYARTASPGAPSCSARCTPATTSERSATPRASRVPIQ